MSGASPSEYHQPLGASPQESGIVLHPLRPEPSLLEELSLPKDLRQILIDNAASSSVQRFGSWVLDECRQDPQAGRLYQEKLLPIVQDLLETPELRRLDEVFQMTATYTVHGHFISHTRLLHSSDVMRGAVTMAAQNKMDDYWSSVLGLAGLLHDLGHVAFSHTGELALMNHLDKAALDRLGLAGSFCHEAHGHNVIRNGVVGEILKRHGINPEDVINVLHESHPLNPIVDLADRGSYIIRDNTMTELRKDLKLAAAQDVRKAQADIGIESVDRFGEATPRAYFRDTENAQAVLAHRAVLFSEYSWNTASLLANQVIEQELVNALNAKKFTVEQFLNMNDEQAIAHFRPDAQKWLARYTQSGQVTGVEDHFDEVAAWSFNELTTLGQVHARDPELAGRFNNYLLQKGFDPENVFLVSTNGSDKQVNFPVKGDRRSPNLVEIVPDTERFVAVFAARENHSHQDLQKLRALTIEFFRRFVSSDSAEELQAIHRPKSLGPRKVERYAGSEQLH